jgi:prepilin-type N-terminal cleavage/methylation domain-containing protein
VFKRTSRCFTLVEVLIVVGIIGVLAAVAFVSVSGAIRDAKITQATQNAEKLKVATELYFRDLGFYPPDTNRGADPGFTQPLPYFPDGHTGTELSSDAHCPEDWEDIVASQWKGPYLPEWPIETPWGGKYDYNYWASGGGRYGCTVPPGIYMGIQRDYSEQGPIPSSIEQQMLDLGYDKDGCLNSEAQLLLIKF